MALKITCPNCKRPHRLENPYPPPGSELQCSCGRLLALTYSPQAITKIRNEGGGFLGEARRIVAPPLAPPSLSRPDDFGFPQVNTSYPAEDNSFPDAEERRTVVEREDMDEEAPTVMDGGDDDDAPGEASWQTRSAPAAPPPPVQPQPRAAQPRAAQPQYPPQPQYPSQQQYPPQYPPQQQYPAQYPPQQQPRYTTPPGASTPPPGANTPPPRAVAPQWASRPYNEGPAMHGQPPPPPAMAMAPPARRSKLRWLAWLFLLITLLGAAAVAGVYWFFSQDLASLESLQDYRPPTVTLVYDRHGEVLGEIYNERRYVVPFEAFPQHLKDAFLASEDANFYNHRGVDPMGIVRAMLRNLSEGEMAQGASTITQQVARNFLLSNEKKLARKVREMILAGRIEETFDKDRILWLYLNQIYLGSRAYGVEAAARIYFDKHVEELTIAESALLAGLPQRPSDYSPHKAWDKARARQEYVLGQMLDKGFIDKATYEAALAEPIKIVKTENPTRVLAPTFTEEVRRHLVTTYGEERVYNEGLIVHTTCDLKLQQVAQESVTKGVQYMDEQVGWRGPVEKLLDDAAIKARLKKQEDAMRDLDQHLADNARRGPLPERSSLRLGDRFEAVVLEVEAKHAKIGIGSHEALIPLSWTTWGYEPNPERSWRSRTQDNLTRTLSRGDVVNVTIEALKASEAKPFEGYAPAAKEGLAAARLYQAPELEGALLSFDLNTGEIRAMVGGVDIEKSEYNRAVQAQRQVGSTFKPVVYAAAIEGRRYTAGSIVLDAPLSINTLDDKLWKPGNYSEEYLGNITLRRALALSKNTVTVRVIGDIGVDPVLNMAKKLGITSPLQEDQSIALGSGSLTVLELSRAYSVFATYGDKVEPYFIERVEDRDGKVLEKHEGTARERVLDPTVAGIVTWLLQEVTAAGTAAETNKLGLHVAGKTGTTNDFMDAWFVGFNPDVMTTVWVGYDKPKSLGVSSTGGKVALPIWMSYMKEAVPKSANRPFPPIPGAQYAPIDESTGRVASGGRSMPFLSGTVPEASGGEIGQATSEDMLTRDF